MGFVLGLEHRHFSNSAQPGCYADNERRVDQGSSRFDNPPLYDKSDIKFDALADCIK